MINVTFKVVKYIHKWDEEIKKYEFWNIYQTTIWAKYMKEMFYAKPYFLKIFLNNRTIWHLIFFEKSVLAENNVNLGIGFINKLLYILWFKRLWWQIWPLLINTLKLEVEKIVINKLLKFILDNFPKVKILPSSYYFLADFLGLQDKKWSKVFWGYNVKLRQTYLFDYKNCDNDVLGCLSKKTRYKLRKQLNLLDVFILHQEKLFKYNSDLCLFDCLGELNKSDINYFINQYNNILKEDKRNLWHQLPPHYINRKAYKLLKNNSYLVIISKKGKESEILWWASFFYFNNISHFAAPWILPKYKTNTFFVGDLIQLWALEFWRYLGIEKYDLMGVAYSPSNLKEQWIKKFKKKYSNVEKNYYYFSN